MPARPKVRICSNLLALASLGLALACIPLAAPHILAQADASQPSTFRVTSQLVIEDVTVVDSHGNPVHGLRPSQFTVLEDGKPQLIRGFDEYTTPAEVAKFPPMPRLPPDVFTNYTPVPEGGAVNVILLDSLNTPLQSQAYVKQQLQDYMKSIKPGTRIAIFAMDRELHLLQGFTSNPELLRAIVDGKKNGMQLSTLMDNGVSGDLGPDSSMSDSFSADMANTPSATQALQQIQQFEAETQSFELELRAEYTLDALNQLARYLAGLPGRKNVIWFSGSFPIDLLPNGDLADPFSVMGNSEDEFRETVTLMSRSHVALFPVDARGLMVNANLNAENDGHKYAANPSQFTKDTNSFLDQTADEHDTMLQMAEKTGGKAFINTNGLKEAVVQAIDFGSNYYSISYYPTHHKWDGKFHTISIKVSDPRLKLSYRIGYYADDPNGPPNKAAKPIFGSIAAVSTPTPPVSARVNAMRAAMQFGAPQPTQIIMKVRVLPVGAGNEDKLAAGNIADPKTHGPYQLYGIDYAIDARHIQFVANPDGTFQAKLEFAVLVYDDQGRPINTLSKVATADQITEARKAVMLKSGIQMHQEISVPMKGHYWLRVGVHDETGDQIGAVEVNLDRVTKPS